MKWRMALRIASLPNERWMVKAAEWNPELSSRYKTYRAIGRPRRRWEDDINEFLKLEENETENPTESENNSWIKAAKDCGRWILLEKDYTMTAEEIFENNAGHRRNHQNRPARYVNGVRLSEDEVADITQTKSKKSADAQNEANLKAETAPRSAHRMSQGCRHKQMAERSGPEHLDGR